MDCPLCLEELDISDLNFKPCPCGYQVRARTGCIALWLGAKMAIYAQICRFCWHHIKENLNGRCPACRKEYTNDAVEFKPMKPEE